MLSPKLKIPGILTDEARITIQKCIIYNFLIVSAHTTSFVPQECAGLKYYLGVLNSERKHETYSQQVINMGRSYQYSNNLLIHVINSSLKDFRMEFQLHILLSRQSNIFIGNFANPVKACIMHTMKRQIPIL